MKRTKESQESQEPDDLLISTSVENSILIMREIDKIHFWKRMSVLMPQLLKVLIDAGADFSKCVVPTEAEVEAAIQGAMKENFF